MNTIIKRLSCLNLALLLTVLLTVPAAAAPEEISPEDSQTDEAVCCAVARRNHSDSAVLQDPNRDVPPPEREYEEEPEFEDALTEDEEAPVEDEEAPAGDEVSLTEAEDEEVSLLEETPVIILDKGVHVYPGRDANGYGWYYDDSANELTLTSNYSGGSISIYSGLTLWIEDDVTISATDDSTFGYHAIVHDPIAGTSQYSSSLVISGQPNASLTVNGGDGDYGGGTAIYSSDSVYCSVDAVLTGGNSTYSYDPYNDTHASAGDGIWAQGITLVSQNVSAYGGNVLTTSNAMEGYGGYGLYASRSISVYGSNHTSVGGDAAYFGGYGARAPSVSITAENSSFTGGDATTYGGAGILGSTCVSLSNGSISVTGGNADVHGGYGILTPQAVIRADCTLQGGYGYSSPAPGLFYESTCIFGANNITMINGGNEIAFKRAYGSSVPSFSPHTDTYGYGTNYSTIYIRIKDYWLDLYGHSSSGYGFYDGDVTFSSLEPYGTRYDLADYMFESTTRTQVGWGARSNTTGKSILPLNTVVVPTTNTELYAIWTSVTPENLIVLNGMEGLVKSTARYTASIGESVKLPTSLIYEDSRELLAWSSEPVPKANPTTGILSGVWYEGGITVSTTPDHATLLYGQSDIGTYAIYHPNGGSFKNGGGILVQGTRSTDSNLTVYTPDASVITPPKGSALAGWATSASAVSPTYGIDESLTLKQGKGPVHLYPVWKPEEFSMKVNDLTVTHCPTTKTVTVSGPRGWNLKDGFLTAVLYSESGMIQSYRRQAFPFSASFRITLTYPDAMPELRLFLTDAAFHPTAAREAIPLTTLSRTAN